MKACKAPACLLFIGFVLLQGCSIHSSTSRLKNATKSTSGSNSQVGTVAKKKTSSDYLQSRAKYYDAGGTCTMEIRSDYNAAGKEVHHVQENYGKYSNKTESYYTYPDAATCMQTFIDSDTGLRSQVNTTTYNTAGNISTQIMTDYTRDKVKGDVMSRTEYTYDKQGCLLLKERYGTGTLGGELNDIDKTTYINNSSGLCASAKDVISTAGQKDQVTSNVEYQYDGNGNKVRAISQIPDKYTYSPIVYEYDANNWLVKESDYDSMKSDTLVQYYLFEYDKNGNQTKYTRYSSENKLLSYAEFEYIKAGTSTSIAQDSSPKALLFGTWYVSDVSSAVITFASDGSSNVTCQVEGFDISSQQPSEGASFSTNATITDDTIEIDSGPDESVKFSYELETDGSF